MGKPSEEEMREMHKLTGIEWDIGEIQMNCRDYWESPHSLEETAYYPMHEECSGS